MRERFGCSGYNLGAISKRLFREYDDPYQPNSSKRAMSERAEDVMFFGIDPGLMFKASTNKERRMLHWLIEK